MRWDLFSWLQKEGHLLLSPAAVRYYLGRLMPLEVAAFPAAYIQILSLRVRDIRNLDAALAAVAKPLSDVNAPGTLARVRIICKLVQVYREMQLCPWLGQNLLCYMHHGFLHIAGDINLHIF